MRTHTLGRTGLAVTELSLGGLFFSKIAADRAEGIRTVRGALELGINYIDTAPSYLDSEEVLGEALEGVTQPYILSTKLGYLPEPFEAQDKALLRRSFENSLRLLRRESVDILMIHEPDRPGQFNWWSDYESYTGPVTELMAELKDEGRIRYTGLGGTSAYELARIMDTGQFDVVLAAFNYSLLWREAEWEIFPTARKHNMGVIIGSPLQQGALAQRYDEQVNSGAPWMSLPRRRQFQALYRLLDEMEMPLPELAMRFVISHPEVDTVLTGARSVAEVEANLRALEKGPLPEDLLERLQEIYEMVPFRPWEEPTGLPFNRIYYGPGAGR